jgi:hypothetical protein
MITDDVFAKELDIYFKMQKIRAGLRKKLITYALECITIPRRNDYLDKERALANASQTRGI